MLQCRFRNCKYDEEAAGKFMVETMPQKEAILIRAGGRGMWGEEILRFASRTDAEAGISPEQ